MDAIDKQILRLLTENSRTTSSDIAKEVHLSIPAVAERIRKLDEQNIIESFTVKLNRRALGYAHLVYISVVLPGTLDTDVFRKAMREHAFVMECHHIAGEYDYLLKVSVPDTDALEYFITDSLKKQLGVLKSNTVFVLSTVKEKV
ncbi:Lrp/AsnC family transcriptional regulator [Gorillibacterium massiliense]|uniref:Lrp/AsnC family transcriptional regulator n=1 Tax=Gorillibacterium massiliense TaxID=1280390 RepID=UPI0004B50E34|nr:Lrp/AsnC family transcriptional regulator [Gorillibacterium massiliense]